MKETKLEENIYIYITTLKSGSGARLLKDPIINRAPTPADTMLALVEVLKLKNSLLENC